MEVAVVGSEDLSMADPPRSLVRRIPSAEGRARRWPLSPSFLLALVATGCSFFVTGRPTPPAEPVDCSPMLTTAVVDTAGALPFSALTVAGLVVLAQGCEQHGDGLSCQDQQAITSVTVIVGALAAVIYGWAAGTGYSSYARCKKNESSRESSHHAIAR